MKRFLVTGGAGFIGSALIRFLINETHDQVLNLDKLTYAGNLESLVSVSASSRYKFVRGDISERSLVAKLLREFKPDFVIHLAAETHVDRSIDHPAEFIKTNIVGTSIILECVREYWRNLPSSQNELKGTSPHRLTELTTKESFRFHHISTDEVYGSLDNASLFSEETAYDPSSPYSASKASSDHLVRSWHRTYGLPVLITNCSNNYGPYQFPEKLIPLIILNALNKEPLPIYGKGQQIRDWLHVEDHVRALYKVVTKGQVGETYNIGGHNEKTNLEVVHSICDILDELIGQNRAPREIGPQANILKKKIIQENLTFNKIDPSHVESYKNLITFVADRPGHDQRYAIDARKIQKCLGWSPVETFETGLRKTVEWYCNNLDWCRQSLIGGHQRQKSDFIEKKGT